MTEQPIAVTQGDRDTALALRHLIAGQLRRLGIDMTVMPPADDADEVQLIARHRLDERERCAKVAENCPIIGVLTPGWPDGAASASRQIATTIREVHS